MRKAPEPRRFRDWGWLMTCRAKRINDTMRMTHTVMENEAMTQSLFPPFDALGLS
jgi:hypothetical protein